MTSNGDDLKQNSENIPGLPHGKPNIVIVLVDDLGNADLGYRGSKIKTPNIDKLANTGVRLEDYYGLPLCTPARAALLTGRYPMRYGLQSVVIFPSHTYGLDTDELTLPQALKNAGYKTAMAGKWHLGHADTKYWPQNRGFDHFYGNVMGEVDYYTKIRGGIIDWQRNGKFMKEEGYYTTLIGNEAVNIIDQHDTKDPLFLYVASLAAHTPLEAPEESIKAYEEIFPEKEKQIYAAMITEMDKQIGRITKALEEKGMLENTIIFFTTDNGGVKNMKVHAPGTKGAVHPPASNGDFRGGKATLYEGGVRLPAFINWPAVLKPAVINEPLHHVDIMPTLLAAAGGSGDENHPFDGMNAWGTIADSKPSPHDDILINVEFFRGAVRKGIWKFIKLATLPGKTELFDLSKDPGEKNNVAGEFPEVVKDLEDRLIAYANEQKMSLWVKAQPGFLNVQGIPAFAPEYDITDGGLPDEKPVVPDVMKLSHDQ
ncbi:MAG TPA: arylsulfatase [Ignavibacteria bacterium]|nr:arylsulfatase [Ignavibacteria bacterium]